MDQQDKAKPDPGHGHHEIAVEVFSPRQPEPKQFAWRRDMRVGDAAAEAAAAFGYEGGAPSFQNDKGEVLDRNKPLAAEHVKDGDRLELVDTGGGV